MAVVPKLLKHTYYVPLIDGTRRFDLGVWYTKRVWIGYA